MPPTPRGETGETGESDVAVEGLPAVEAVSVIEVVKLFKESLSPLLLGGEEEVVGAVDAAREVETVIADSEPELELVEGAWRL